MDFNNGIVEFARRFSFVREVGGANLGFWVGMFQHFTGNAGGDSWCASFVSFVLSVMFGGKGNSPYPVTASSEVLHAHAVARQYITITPQPGDLYFFLDANGRAHHVGIVTRGLAINTIPVRARGIAGNTSESGTSSNGDGVHEHTVWPPVDSLLVFATYPRPA